MSDGINLDWLQSASPAWLQFQMQTVTSLCPQPTASSRLCCWDVGPSLASLSLSHASQRGNWGGGRGVAPPLHGSLGVGTAAQRHLWRPLTFHPHPPQSQPPALPLLCGHHCRYRETLSPPPPFGISRHGHVENTPHGRAGALHEREDAAAAGELQIGSKGAGAMAWTVAEPTCHHTHTGRRLRAPGRWAWRVVCPRSGGRQ